MGIAQPFPELIWCGWGYWNGSKQVVERSRLLGPPSKGRRPGMSKMSSDTPYDEEKLCSDGMDERLLSRSDGLSLDSLMNWKSRHSSISRRMLFIHFALLACNAGFLLLNLFSFRCNDNIGPNHGGIERPYSPALAGMRYTIQSINTHDPNDTFTGKPRLEVDESWSRLLRSTTIRVTADELRALNQPSLQLKDGSGYIGYVDVFHQLHCLKRLYQSQYPEVYADLAAKGSFTLEHRDHCFQVLRKAIMCNADPTFNTLVPDPENPFDLVSVSEGPRKCVDWERFEAWAYERAIGTEIHSLLKKGEYGEVGPADVVAKSL